MFTPTLLAIADDLTGALETGAILAGEGVRCRVSVDERVPEDVDAAVLNVATRHLEAEPARAAVQRATRRARATGVRHLYLKTDSTLRGRIAESIDVLLEEFPELPLMYVPAYPSLGRTVRGGRLFVHGVPVHETAFACDSLNPVRESSIPALLNHPDRVTIFDGVEDADLATAARALGKMEGPYIAAGTAAFVRYWVRILPIPRTAPPPARISAKSGIIAIGSRHPLSRAQAAHFVPCDGWTLLATPDNPAGEPPLAVARRLAAGVRTAILQNEPTALIVFGGDTAGAILEHLDCREAEPLCELLPGVPASRIFALGRPLTLITKAGGFGDEHTLARILAILEQ